MKSKTRKRNQEKKSINRKFINNPKGVYRDFKRSNIRLEEIPAKDKLQLFWQKYLPNRAKFNKSIDKTINDMQLNKSPGRDLITWFWKKRRYFYRNKLTDLYQSM